MEAPGDVMSILNPFVCFKFSVVTVAGIFLSVTCSSGQEQTAINYKSAYETVTNITNAFLDSSKEMEQSTNNIANLLNERQLEIEKKQKTLTAEFNKLQAKKINRFLRPEKSLTLIELEKKIDELKLQLLSGRVVIEEQQKSRDMIYAEITALELASVENVKSIDELKSETSKLENQINILTLENGINTDSIRLLWKDVLEPYGINSFEALFEFFTADLKNAVGDGNSIVNTYNTFQQVPQGASYVLWDEEKDEPFDLGGFNRRSFYKLPVFKELSVSLEFPSYAKLSSPIALDRINSDRSWNTGSTNSYTECVSQNLTSKTEWLYDLCRSLHSKFARLNIEDTRQLYGINSGTLLLSSKAAFKLSELFLSLEKDLYLLTKNELPQKFVPWLSSYLNEKTSEKTKMLEEELELQGELSDLAEEAKTNLEAINQESDISVEFVSSIEEQLNKLEENYSSLVLSYVQELKKTELKNKELEQEKELKLTAIEKQIDEIIPQVTKNFASRIARADGRVQSLEAQRTKLRGDLDNALAEKDKALNELLKQLEKNFLAKNLKVNLEFIQRKYYGDELCFEAETPDDVFLSISRVGNFYFKGQLVPDHILDYFLSLRSTLRPTFQNKYKETIYGINGKFDTNRVCVPLDKENISGKAARWFEKVGGFSTQADAWQIEFQIQISAFDLFKENDRLFYKEQAPVDLKLFFAEQIKEIEEGISSLLEPPKAEIKEPILKLDSVEPAADISSEDPASTERDNLPQKEFSRTSLLQINVSKDVKEIQSMLRQLGYYKSSIDGLWGPGSQAALQNFKMMKNLPNTLIWDLETQNLIMQLTNATD